MCVALFCIDYYNGWYASGMLWLLIGRDLALTLQKALLYWRAYRIVTSQSESH